MEGYNNDLSNVKSLDGSKKSFLTFHNRTQRTVDVLWVNYQGNPVLYKTLLPGEYFDANTFVTHPWVFKDNTTRDALVVNSCEVYMPTEWNGEIDRIVRRENQVYFVPRRTAVNITLPLYSLLYRTMQAIRNCLTDNVKRDCLKGSFMSINNLGLPETVKMDLVHYIKKSCEHMY